MVEIFTIRYNQTLQIRDFFFKELVVNIYQHNIDVKNISGPVRKLEKGASNCSFYSAPLLLQK